ncbi:7-carboxy-7-deazaguanine synthase [uncultured archaeon]|nr:7-carboxy-7-deazaguanine synthase [uncultured archaeon]
MNSTMPFDPIQRSRDAEQVVMRGDKRRYYRFRFAKFYGGIVTADAVGCNLLCAYCWNYSRNLNPGNIGDYNSPSEVAGRLIELAGNHDCHQFRISGAEPILGMDTALHLADVIRRLDGSFIIETNGVMLGADPSLIEILEPLSNIQVRLCVKAHSGTDFEKITGAKAEGLDYQLRTAEALRKAGISHTIAVMQPFVDPDRLPCQVDEVEDLTAYGSTERNLRQRGLVFQY